MCRARAGVSRKVVVGILAACAGIPAESFGQGLLGQKYVGFEFQLDRPNSELLQEISEWGYAVNVVSNYPLTETIDISAEIGNGWFGGTAVDGGIPIEFDTDITEFSVRLNKHLWPDELIDPFAGIGIGYVKGTLEASSGGITLIGTDEEAFVDFVAGFEWRFNDRFTLRPQIQSASSLEDFDVDEVLDDNLFFNTYVVSWWTEHWFSAVGVGSDFDDVDVQLSFLLGFGNWVPRNNRFVGNNQR